MALFDNPATRPPNDRRPGLSTLPQDVVGFYKGLLLSRNFPKIGPRGETVWEPARGAQPQNEMIGSNLILERPLRETPKTTYEHEVGTHGGQSKREGWMHAPKKLLEMLGASRRSPSWNPQLLNRYEYEAYTREPEGANTYLMDLRAAINSEKDPKKRAEMVRWVAERERERRLSPAEKEMKDARITGALRPGKQPDLINIEGSRQYLSRLREKNPRAAAEREKEVRLYWTPRDGWKGSWDPYESRGQGTYAPDEE